MEPGHAPAAGGVEVFDCDAVDGGNALEIRFAQSFEAEAEEGGFALFGAVDVRAGVRAPCEQPSPFEVGGHAEVVQELLFALKVRDAKANVENVGDASHGWAPCDLCSEGGGEAYHVQLRQRR